jgi:hypothetical protein
MRCAFLECVAILLAVTACAKSQPASDTASPAGSAASTSTKAPLTPGCMRERKTHVYRCSGVPPEEGESNSSPTVACDRCITNAHCADKPGGACVEVGDQMCGGPRRWECRYPDPACGGKICPEREIAPPPSTPD